ncbi:hypothetical protein EJ05DRAFT_302613 [Pseudovirgaria hyperparasitica]|uniref:Uncharacterized protein n=1 Tax=Pseudovirgaria hyperparasitica TaxID=470096 RepID=A0A6A6WC07_9PEZI|nr:uncharacterized protein EJ05DRAFT_302613 [Pseudovirgaria hyperparasitica]KAF2759574.1 hypothetical protein EJ05DRAFT_302613 [Pseudovirgaria hyperparasitica]
MVDAMDALPEVREASCVELLSGLIEAFASANSPTCLRCISSMLSEEKPILPLRQLQARGLGTTVAGALISGHSLEILELCLSRVLPMELAVACLCSHV